MPTHIHYILIYLLNSLLFFIVVVLFISRIWHKSRNKSTAVWSKSTIYKYIYIWFFIAFCIKHETCRKKKARRIADFFCTHFFVVILDFSPYFWCNAHMAQACALSDRRDNGHNGCFFFFYCFSVYKHLSKQQNVAKLRTKQKRGKNKTQKKAFVSLTFGDEEKLNVCALM